MKWFVHQNNKVNGPYSETEIEQLSRAGSLSAAFLWSRGLTDWLSSDRWSLQMATKLRTSAATTTLNTAPTAKQPAPEEKTQTITTSEVQSPRPDFKIIPSETTKALDAGGTKTVVFKKNDQRYKVQYDFQDQGYMNIEELIKFTSVQPDVSKIAVYDGEKKEWKEVYSIPEISDKLGITRRKNSRVPIMAQFTGHSHQGDKINSRIVTISVGGMGLTDNFNLTIGEAVQGQITSPHFFTPLPIEAEVTYTGHDGYIGLKFIQVNDDSLALITEYVNKFSQQE